MERLRVVRTEVAEFCSSTSIQGLRGVADQNQAFVFRLIWLIIVVVSFICAGICIKESIDGKLL